MTAVGDWRDVTNMLCVRLDNLGDLLMTTPAIRAVRESRPGRRITLLTSRSGGAVAALIPEIDDVITYDAPWVKGTTDAEPRLHHALVERLSAGRFDGCVIFTVYSQSALPAAMLAWTAGIPRRLAHCRENPYELLTDWTREPEPAAFVRHEVERQLDLVRAIGCTTADTRFSLRVPEHERAAADARLQRLGIDRSAPWAIVHPGATAPSRRYPPEHFADVVRLLVVQHGWPIIITGTAGERALAAAIASAAGVPTHNLAGALTLGGLAALIEAAPVLIANNTGPVHIAAAVGTPVVDLYALTNMQHTPWRVPHRVLFHDVPCRGCYRSVCPEGHHDCLRKVPPATVVTAAAELVATSRRSLIAS